MKQQQLLALGCWQSFVAETSEKSPNNRCTRMAFTNFCGEMFLPTAKSQQPTAGLLVGQRVYGIFLRGFERGIDGARKRTNDGDCSGTQQPSRSYVHW